MSITEFAALDLLFLMVFTGLGVYFIYGIHVSRRRKKLLKEPLPKDWEEILKRNVPIYKKLPEDEQNQLKGLVNIFLDEKRFEGCGGLEITDEIKVTIAGQACVLLLNRKTNFFPKLSFILVYPHAYVAQSPRLMGNVVINDQSARLGESWVRGSLVLAWDHAKQSARDIHDGHNVVLHEFAHQLDQEDGNSDGKPLLEESSQHLPWARILGEEYDLLRYEVSHHIKDVINEYGATNPAEFFAVATETFFERPRRMRNKHPKLYDQLKMYYKLDPFEWASKAKSSTE